MSEHSTFFASDRDTWRTWLHANHETSNGVWLVFYKKSVPKPSCRYEEALEEALCFGWIDNLRKRLDHERYMQKFTPRKPKSKWSALNLKLVEKLKAEGRMTAIGLSKMEGAQRAASIEMRAARVKGTNIAAPPEFDDALTKNKKARAYFDQLSPSHRRMYLLWITSAKQDETRLRRINEAVAMLAQRKKLGLK